MHCCRDCLNASSCRDLSFFLSDLLMVPKPLPRGQLHALLQYLWRVYLVIVVCCSSHGSVRLSVDWHVDNRDTHVLSVLILTDTNNRSLPLYGLFVLLCTSCTVVQGLHAHAAALSCICAANSRNRRSTKKVTISFSHWKHLYSVF